MELKQTVTVKLPQPRDYRATLALIVALLFWIVADTSKMVHGGEFDHNVYTLIGVGWLLRAVWLCRKPTKE